MIRSHLGYLSLRCNVVREDYSNNSVNIAFSSSKVITASKN